MKAFHGDLALKQKYIDQIKSHMDADEIIKGKYWEDGKGGSIGCVLHSSYHEDYEDLIGLPVWFAYLQDEIFKRLPNIESKEFTLRLFKAINVDSDLEKIRTHFLIFLLEYILKKLQEEKFYGLKKTIDLAIDFFKNPNNANLSNRYNRCYKNVNFLRRYLDVVRTIFWAFTDIYNPIVRNAAREVCDSCNYNNDDSVTERFWVMISEKLIELVRNQTD